MTEAASSLDRMPKRERDILERAVRSMAERASQASAVVDEPIWAGVVAPRRAHRGARSSSAPGAVSLVGAEGFEPPTSSL